MMPFPPSISYASVSGPSNEKYKELAERRIRIVKRMTTALFQYLTFSDQLTVDTFDDPVEIPSIPSSYYTLDSLVSAQKYREQLQSQIDQMEAGVANLDDKMSPIKTIMETMMIAPLRHQIEQCEESITRIQEELEKKEKK